MANSTIAQLNSANPLTGAELIYLDDGTSDVKASATIFRNYIYNTAATINATSHGILLGNSAANLIANATTLQIGTFTANTLLVNTAALNVTGQINTATIFISSSVNVGSSVVNSLGTFSAGTINAAAHTVGTAFIANTLGVFSTGTVNAAVHSTTGVVVNATAITATSNTILLGNTIGRFVLAANSADIGPNFVANSLGAYHTATINAASLTTSGVVVNTTAIAPTSNTILLGNTIGRFVLTANSADIGPNFVANSLGAYHTATINAATIQTSGVVINTTAVNPTSNAIGLGNTIGRFVITANSVSTQGATINATVIAPTSNTILLGNSIGQFVITANSITTSGATINATVIAPTSNTILLGNSIGQFVVTANSVTTGGATLNSSAICPTSNTILLGNSIGRFVITANSVTTSNTGLVTSTTAAANGATYLTGGILMQWGWVLANTSVGNATFPIAFPTTCFSVSTGSVNALASETTRAINYQLAPANTTVAQIRTANATVGTNVAYIALGN